MGNSVALTHTTRYRFDRPVLLSPHEIRLRPAPYCRTPILSYALTVVPAGHVLTWQQDPHNNYLARVVFSEKATELAVVVKLVADMTVINPFGFLVDPYAETFPFAYPSHLTKELRSFLEVESPGQRLTSWLSTFKADHCQVPKPTIDFLVTLNRRIENDVEYLVRLEPGIQTCEQTLQKRSGSCRDSAWLEVQILRHLGLAARFASGYLIQLVPDVEPVEHPAEPARDHASLHAWAEVYVPGGGWIGLDPTSGLFAGEGHLQLASTAFPSLAAPVTGSTEPCEVKLDFALEVIRMPNRLS